MSFHRSDDLYWIIIPFNTTVKKPELNSVALKDT